MEGEVGGRWENMISIQRKRKPYDKGDRLI